MGIYKIQTRIVSELEQHRCFEFLRKLLEDTENPAQNDPIEGHHNVESSQMPESYRFVELYVRDFIEFLFPQSKNSQTE